MMLFAKPAEKQEKNALQEAFRMAQERFKDSLARLDRRLDRVSEQKREPTEHD